MTECNCTSPAASALLAFVYVMGWMLSIAFFGGKPEFDRAPQWKQTTVLAMWPVVVFVSCAWGVYCSFRRRPHQ